MKNGLKIVRKTNRDKTREAKNIKNNRFYS